jgi:predicted ester cyclase
VAEGDRVAVRWTFRGTHRGYFMGIAPTGNQVEMGAMDLLRVAGGKIAETWSNVDMMAMLRQLGAIPTPERSEEGSLT